MQFHAVKLVLVAACMLLPACATKEVSAPGAAQIWAEMEFDRLSHNYEGKPEIVILYTCYDLYGFLNESYTDFESVLECYYEQRSDEDSASEETGPRDLSPKAQSPRDLSPKVQPLRDLVPKAQSPRDLSPKDQSANDLLPKAQSLESQ